ncbi:helix-turn-helix domain-containing protein [Notoacmeibacter sp. MSK16QG-6]|uniref:helix-turn-helix domain-containing protein n=1 Tax=Notoacmeibacter sp. MSK16QG-6 TaxID=2957982 RepID=UPI00209C94CF|nr:helix-turn-helix domain-containing protein [Notoacmeibacter sp. MSK16QG-6]MCP1198150.1 chromosomal replication initiator DnaA [Notoacmeibacter sp. MSK16QG-6]
MTVAQLRLHQIDEQIVERVRGRGIRCHPSDRKAWAMQQGDAAIDLIAAIFAVDGRDIRKPTRCGMEVGRVRHVAMYVCHVTLQLTLTEVGMVFGRDRTTATHACHRVEDLRDDADFDALMDAVERTVAYTLRIDRGEIFI